MDAGCEQHDRRIGGRGRRSDRLQRLQQFVRIILHRRDAVAREQLGKQPQHDLAVLQHVGDTRRRARVVLEHIESLGIDAHDVDAGNVHVNVVRNLLAIHLRAENRILKDEVLGHDARFENFAAVIDVLDVGVDGLDALLEAALEDVPFRCRKDAWNDVEGDEPLLRLGVAIDRKGDADPPEQQLRLAPAEVENVGLDLTQPVREGRVGRPHGRVGASVAPHFVKHIEPRPAPVSVPCS